MNRKLIIILGPTAVGKTDYSIEMALKYDSPIISCDSRQIYKEMSIGTAVPSAEQLAAVQHYFIHSHTVTELYTAGKYEIEALDLINKLFDQGHETLVMAGGSGFYVDALVNGLDDFPSADLKLRDELMRRLKEEGVEELRLELKALDPESYETIDIANGQRVVRALEVCLMTGKPFSSFKTAEKKARDFEIEKIGLTRPREVLYDRINRRVLQMIDEGLVDDVAQEIRQLVHLSLYTIALGVFECGCLQHVLIECGVGIDALDGFEHFIPRTVSVAVDESLFVEGEFTDIFGHVFCTDSFIAFKFDNIFGIF